MTTATPTALDQLSADYWAAWLERHPVFATAIGDRRFDDRLDDDSPAGQAAWRTELDGFEGRLREADDSADQGAGDGPDAVDGIAEHGAGGGAERRPPDQPVEDPT